MTGKAIRRNRSILWTILFLAGLALLIRIVYFKQLATNPFFPHAIVDSDGYDKMAVKIAGGEEPFPGLPFFQPPLYPYFLGLVYSLFGRSLGAVRFLQMLLGAGNILLTYILARRLFGPRIAFGAGVGLSVYGPMLFFEGELLAPVLIVLLNLSFILSLLAFFEKPALWKAFLSGCLLGASAITMAVVLPFAAVVLIYGFFYFRRQTAPSALWAWKKKAVMGLLFLLGMAAVIGPVTLRNRRVGGDWVLISSNGGINFYVGTGKDFDRKVGIRPGYQWQALGQEPMKKGYKKPSAQSAYFMGKARREILEDPLEYAGTLTKKLHLFAHGNEIMRNQEIYPFRKYSSLLSVLVWKHGLAFPYGLLFPLAAVGAFLAGVREKGPSRLLLLFILSHMLVIILFFVCARYRMNVLPFLVILAAYGVAAFAGYVQKRAWGKTTGMAAAFFALVVVCNWNAGAMSMDFNADAYYNLGVKYMDENPPEAGKMFRKAIALNPDYPEANGNLGILAHADGDLKQARACFELVLRQYPDDVEANINLGIVLFSEGDTESAKRQFRKVLTLAPRNAIAMNNLRILERGVPPPSPPTPPPRIAGLLQRLREDPENPALLTNLGAAYLAMKDYASALGPLQKAVALAPALPQAYNNLGIALINLGKTKEAELAFRKALQLNPDNVSARKNLEKLMGRDEKK